MIGILEQVKRLYALEGRTFAPVSGHEGGRNQIVTVSRNGEKQYVLRFSRKRSLSAFWLKTARLWRM